MWNKIYLAKTLKPYQGLKQDKRFFTHLFVNLAKTLKPYQGLKQNAELE